MPRVISRLFVAAVATAALFVPNIQSAAAETPAAEHYRAVIDPVVHKEEPYPSYSSIDPMVVFPEGVDYSGGPVPNESEIVYCFNISKPFPTNDAAVRFERNAGEPLKNYADNRRRMLNRVCLTP